MNGHFCSIATTEEDGYRFEFYDGEPNKKMDIKCACRVLCSTIKDVDRIFLTHIMSRLSGVGASWKDTCFQGLLWSEDCLGTMKRFDMAKINVLMSENQPVGRYGLRQRK